MNLEREASALSSPSAEEVARVLAAMVAQESEVKTLLQILEPFDAHRLFLELRRFANGKLALRDLSDTLRWLLPEVAAMTAVPPGSLDA